MYNSHQSAVRYHGHTNKAFSYIQQLLAAPSFSTYGLRLIS